MCREIINSQNAQITFMRSYLAGVGASEEGDLCENDDLEGDDATPGWAIGVMAVLALLSLALVAVVFLVRHSARLRRATTARKPGSSLQVAETVPGTFRDAQKA